MSLYPFLLSLFILNVYGWGGDGHRIITSIALDLMQSRNAESLLEPLGDLMRASTWADTDEADTLYPQSGAYHFSNTPYRKCTGFNMDRDCGFGKTKGICIVTGLSDAISKAIDPAIPPSVRTDSLKFILHLMADIHQPLHTGFREDTGGLRILLGEPQGVDLHAIWDTTVINELRKSFKLDDWRGLQDPLTKRLEENNGTFANRIRSQNDFSEIFKSHDRILHYAGQIASDTSFTATCRSGYRNEDNQWIGVGDNLSPEFYSSRTPIVMVQLLKASVRLASLLDAIAETLYDRRKAIKDSRREERIARLFDRQASPVTSREILGRDGVFSPLFIDFDPNVAEYIPESPAAEIKGAKTKPLRNRKSKVVARSDTTLLEEAIEEVSRERSSYTFYGIDLSQILLVSRSRVLLVSSKVRVRDPSYLPTRIFVPVWFSGSGRLEKHVFGFDANIFKSEMPIELVLRVVLKISGIDPRIDITDYIELIRPVALARPAQSPILDALRKAHTRRQSALGATRKYTLHSRVVELQHKIAVWRISKETFAFLLSDTLRESKRQFHMRLNRFHIHYENGMISMLIDPRIYDMDPDLSDPGFNKLLAVAIQRDVVPAIEYKGLSNELVEVDRILRFRDVGQRGDQAIQGAFVDWVFDYPGNAGRRFVVVEWFRKGVTAEQIMEFLGVANIPTEQSQEPAIVDGSLVLSFNIPIFKIFNWALVIFVIVALFRAFIA